MCGINIVKGRENVIQMNKFLSHRGVRSKYTELADDLYLGHVRLPIQGLSEEFDQPYESGFLTGAMVGELLNFKDFDPKAQCDLPVLLNLPDGIPTSLKDGFWSFVKFDRKENVLKIFMDFLAKKPLYKRMDMFAISSEVKALVDLKPTTFDEIYFSSVAKWGYSLEGRTPFNEIKKLRPGTWMVMNLNERESYHYTFDRMYPDPNIYLRSALKNAVNNRLISDVPVALLMSGGLDSTIIYYLLRELTDKLTIFHIENNESEYFEKIPFRDCDQIIHVNLDQNYDLDTILYMNDGPVDLGSMIPQYQLAQKISEHGFRVCLSGDGADELFGGYSRAKKYDSQASDIHHELVHYHLPRLDKMMMAHKVELRCPFLAKPIVEKAISLPYKDRQDKNYLKKTFQDLIPKEILEREKVPLRYKHNLDWRIQLIEQYKELYNERTRH